MAAVKWARGIVWGVFSGALVAAVAAYRYFLTPWELRFLRGEAAWAALPFVGLALLAGALLLLLRSRDVDDES